MSERAVRVTIGIPSYECERFIGEAVASALAQDVADLEVLVVDDASTDGTLEVLATVHDPRLRVLVNGKRLGPGRNWNRVLAETRGAYVKVMGCDDVLLPGSVAAEAAVLDGEAAVGLVTGPRELITEKGRRLGTRGNGALRGRVGGLQAARAVVESGRNLLGEPAAVLVRTALAREAGGFDEADPYCIDLDMWLRLARVCDVFVLERPVARYRLVASSWSASAAGEQYADVEALLRRTAPEASVDARGLGRGLARARRQARQRRLLYATLFDSEPRRRLLYLLVGGWNTLFGYLAFSVLYFVLHDAVGYVPVLLASYGVSILNAYWGYKRVVFRTDASFREEFPRFALVYLVALAANLVVFPWLTRTLGLGPYLSQAIFTVVQVVATYIVNNRFSFRQASP